MKKYIFILLMFVTTALFAQESSFTSSVSFVGMSMDYKEYSRDGELVDSEESSYLDLAGVEVTLGYIISQNKSSSSEVEFSFLSLSGNTKYIGSDRNSSGLYGSRVSSTFNSIIDTDIAYKRSNNLSDYFELKYGIAFGYREWERALSSSQVEVYSWYSIRPIVGVSTTAIDRFDLGINVEYQLGFNTKMTASEQNLNLDFTLGGADILEVSFPISYMYNKNLDFLFEATMQKQMIDASNVNSGYYEPDSTAHNSYLKVGVEYRF